MGNRMKKCKTCGQDIAKDAVTCPKCGAKNKKPFYRRWWFWLPIILVLLALLACAVFDFRLETYLPKLPLWSSRSEEKEGAEPTLSAEATESLPEESEVAIPEDFEPTEDTRTPVAEPEQTSATEFPTVPEETSSVNPTVMPETEPTETAETVPEETLPAEPKDDMDVLSNATTALGKLNALSSAKNHVSTSRFSYGNLIKKLELELYTYEEAEYAAENCGVDWNEQACKEAKKNLSFNAFSYSALVEELKSEGYTAEQAAYAADHCGADWEEQAQISAERELSPMAFSYTGLIEQLESDGYTHEQAVYGAEENGY